MISIALTTYNGEKYIEEQLLSICNQTLRPDEIVICDDGSKDKTLDIINNIKNKFRKISWKIIINDKNLGYALNFRKAINLCTGDYIFLSDQDDIWNYNKIRSMIDTINIKNEISVLFCKYACIDSIGNKIPNSEYRFNNSIFLFIKALFNTVISISLKNQLIVRNIPGMAMCIVRKNFSFDLLNKIQDSDFYCHDSIIGMISAHNNGLYMLNKPLVNYRLHSENQIGLDNVRDGYKPDRIEWLKLRLNGAKNILKCANIINEANSVDILINEIKLLKYRINCLDNKKIPFDINIFKYNSLLAYVSDVIYILKYFFINNRKII